MKIGVRKYVAKLCCCSILAVLGVFSFFCGTAGAGEGSSARYCLIIKPSAGEDVPASGLMVAPPASGEFRPVKGEKIVSFFRGTVKKIGVGTPDCFFVNGRVQSDPLNGIQQVHTGPESAPARDIYGLNGEEERFFPSVGYFNRVSSDNRGLALGVGLGSAPTDGLDKSPARPEAKVSLVLGFGF